MNRESGGGGLDRREFLAGLGALSATALGTSAVGSAAGKIPYVDGLSFMPDPASSIADSGLTAFILDVSSVSRVDTEDGSIRYYRSFEACARSITAMRRRLRDEIDEAFLATRGSDIDKASQSGKTAVYFQFQGCEPLGEDPSRLDMFYELGLRVQQITHHNDNPFGGGALEKNPSGLTKLGVEAVERMNRLGIIPDISHASDPTSLDVCRASRKPVVLSHGAARSLVNNARCAPDEVIRSIADSGGVMGIFMMSFWLTTDPQPRVDHLIQQLKHVVRVGGVEAAGIANDFPVSGQPQLAEIGNDNAEGTKSYLPWWESIRKQGILGFDRLPQHVVIPELNNLRRMFTIHEALEKDGFTSSQIEKIMGKNWIRVIQASL